MSAVQVSKAASALQIAMPGALTIKELPEYYIRRGCDKWPECIETQPTKVAGAALLERSQQAI
jgi:hypothetical protein